MKSKISLFISIIFLICLLIISSKAQSRNCSKNSFKKADEIIAKILTFGNSGRKFPESLDEVPKYCNDSKSMLETIEKLTKNCMKGLPKQVFSILLYSAKKNFKQLCRAKSKPKRLTELIESAKCINKAHNEIQKCYNITIDNFLGLKQAEDKLKIPMACCAYHRKNTCMSEISSTVDTCTEKHIESGIRFAESISGNALNLVCGEYTENSEKCDSFKVPNKTKEQTRTRSFFLPLIDLFDSFEEV